jgi:hypothetical protein
VSFIIWWMHVWPKNSLPGFNLMDAHSITISYLRQKHRFDFTYIQFKWHDMMTRPHHQLRFYVWTFNLLRNLNYYQLPYRSSQVLTNSEDAEKNHFEDEKSRVESIRSEYMDGQVQGYSSSRTVTHIFSKDAFPYSKVPNYSKTIKSDRDSTTDKCRRIRRNMVEISLFPTSSNSYKTRDSVFQSTRFTTHTCASMTKYKKIQINISQPQTTLAECEDKGIKLFLEFSGFNCK